MARKGVTYRTWKPSSRSGTKRDYAARGAAARAATRALARVRDVEMSAAARYRRRNIRTAGYLGIERKFLDVYASDVAIPAPTDATGAEMQPEGGCTGCLSAPAQGDGEQQRDGRKITLKSCFVNFTVRGSVASDQADVKAAPQVFVALVQDTQANGATVVSEQVFSNPNDTAYVNTYPLRNLQYSARYRVLDHKTVNMAPCYAINDAAATGSLVCSEQTGTLNWKGNMPVTFTGTTADVANVTDNAFHIIAYSTTTNFNPVISYCSRVRFVG